MDTIYSFISSIYPDNTPTWLVTISGRVLSILLLTLAFYLLRHLLRQFFNQYLTPWLSRHFQGRSMARRTTVTTIIKNAIMYSMYFLYGYWLLSILGVPIGTLLAGAGIAGVAIGLGAKDLITDIVNGFFIILEGQYDVGDYVELPDHSISGTVVSVGIRTSTFLAASGDLYYVRNSQITVVNNQSRENQCINIDIPLTDTTNLQDLQALMSEINQEIVDQYQEVLVSEPTDVGVIKNDQHSFSYRISYRVQKGSRYSYGATFYSYYLERIQAAGISIGITDHQFL